MRVVLASAYEMGRQPFGLASPAAHLEAAGFDVTCLDLSRQRLDDVDLGSARLVAFSLPMHTATRIAVELLPRVRQRAPDAVLACYGLYAPLNEEHLRERGAAHVLGPESEAALTELALALRDGHRPPDDDPRALPRQTFRTPSRKTLPALERYAHLHLPDGSTRVAGYVEATRGCKHMCRHCPVVPVYGGRFRAVPVDVVLADIEQQVAAGAEHITFGDPDFLNGPAHALRIVRALHERFPSVSYDATIKVEHLLERRALLPELARTGCALVTTAAEALDDDTLLLLDKGHTRAGLQQAVALCRSAGLALTPTWLPFTPWSSLETYLAFLEGLLALELVESTAPVQLSIRLLLPRGSLLLERPEVKPHVTGFDGKALSWSWRHPDPRMDLLQRRIARLVEDDRGASPRALMFRHIQNYAKRLHAGELDTLETLKVTPADSPAPARCTVPFLNEPWYC